MLIADSPTQLVDQYSTSMIANYSHWTSEASAPIFRRVADLYKRDDINTSFVPRNNFVVYVNSEVFEPKFEIQRTAENISLSANDDTYGELAKPLPFSDRLNTIQGKLTLSITQVAELFGVTRKSVYDWFDDKSMPRGPIITRAEILLDILDENHHSIDLSRLKTVWNIPSSGKSFLAVLNDSSLSTEQLKTDARNKLIELSPRLGQASGTTGDMRVGVSHLTDIDRSSDA